MSQVVQHWFLSEPLLFAAWTTHQVIAQPNVATIRIGRGKIEVNPGWIESLKRQTLSEIMKFEAIRIILKHPYERRKPISLCAYEASNLAIHECTESGLPLPTARDRFGDGNHDRQHFEYYYQLLVDELAVPRETSSTSSLCRAGAKATRELREGCDANDECGDSRNATEAAVRDLCKQDPTKSGIEGYCDQTAIAGENTATWNEDTFLREQINQIIADTEASLRWGSVPGMAQELILATLQPRLDYRHVLRAFRASILSSRRRLTRMKPSRRYGFDYFGSRREFCTKLLFAVDVSGSVDSADVRNAFSVINRLFQYGIETIDVIWFDTEIKTETPLKLSRALQEFRITGRGGTNFQPLMQFLDRHASYDGMIIFTDGIAPVPKPPKKNRRTRIVWLFNHEENWRTRRHGLEQHQMRSAFLR